MRVKPASYRVTLVALGAILLAESLLSTSWSVAQQATVRVSVDRVNSGVFSTQYKRTYTGARRTTELAFDKFLIELYKKDPKLDFGQAVKIMQGFREDYNREINQGGDYNKLKNDNKLYESFFKVGGKVVGKFGLPFSILEEVYKHTRDRNFKELDALLQLNSNYTKHSQYLKMARIEDQTLQEIRKQAQDNRNFALAWDTLRAHELNITATDDARTIMARHPDLPVPVQVKVSIQDNHGEILIALADLKKLSQEEFDKLGAVMAETREDLKAIDAQQDELSAFVKQWKADQDAAEFERQRQATIAAERQLKLQAAGAAIDLLSTFVGLADPKLGRELAVVGRAGLEIYAAFVNYAQMAATLGSLGSGLGAVVLTGSVVNSVMNVTSLFGESGPSPEQLILEELQALREQVAQLHQDMHDRFDRVDAALNTIYTTLNERFNQVDLQLGKIRGDLKQIQQDLLRVELAVNQFETRTFEFMDTVERRKLLMAINGAIGYKERTGLDMPYQPDYVDYENLFHSWAAIHAFDALSTGPTKRSYTDADVLRELQTYPLDVNLTYLNTWLKVHGLPTLAQETLPNPRIWGLASQAYSQVALDWPGHARRIAPIRAQEIKGVGDVLQAALQRIVTTNANRANFALFDGLIDYYSDKARALNQGIQQEERTYLNDLKVRLSRSEDINFWGGSSQPTTYTPASLSGDLAACNGSSPLSSSPGLQSRLQAAIPVAYLLGDYLLDDQQQGLVDACIEARWSNVKTISCPCSVNPPHASVGSCSTGDLAAVIQIYYRGEHAVDFTTSVPSKFVIRQCGGDFRDPWLELWQKWEGDLKPKFEQGHFSLTQWSGKLAVASEVDQALRDHQQALYDEVVKELSIGSLRGAAEELSGAAALLEAFVALGLPTALETNDYLRSFFYGKQRIYDNELVLATYRAVFDQPTVEGYRLDACRLWGTECGAPAADAFCISKGYEGSIGWEVDPDIGAKTPTKILETGEICDQSFCDGFKFIQCQHPESTNARETMTTGMDERRDALYDLLTDYLEQIDMHGSFESHQLIEDTLLQLTVADILARSSAVGP